MTLLIEKVETHPSSNINLSLYIEEWLPGLARPHGAACYAFSKIDPTHNCRRSYQLIYQPGLWSNFCIERTWGRMGSAKQRTMSHEFDNEEIALEFLKRQVAKRLKRGYILR